MKTRFALLLFAIALLPGCSSFSGKPIVGTPTVHEFTVTNVVPVIRVITNEVAGLPPVVVTVTNLVTDVRVVTQTNTVWTVNTNWVNAIQTAKTVNEVANPTATAPLVNLGLGALAAGLAWWARIKNEKQKGAEALLQTVIDGVEASNSAEAKKAIELEATRRGVNATLHALVNK